MGRLVEERARTEGHEVATVITSADAARDTEELAAQLRGLDAAIDFSIASTVLANARAAARAGVPLVVGTTGWREQEQEVRQLIEEQHGALVFGANFSV